MGIDSPQPPAPAPDSDRAELRDAPPFLDWPRIYLIVLGALAVEIVVFAIVTAAAAR
jgi:hypothetical protein